MDTILAALYSLFNITTMFAMIFGGIFGIFVGALPGLSASMAVALLIPFTYFLDTVPALSMIVSLIAMAIFAGDIPGAYLRIPGTPASAAYTNESYLFTQKGKGEFILFSNLISSHLGGLVGLFFLAFLSPLLARIALNFSSFEYFWLGCFGLVCAILVSEGSVLKGILSLMIGLFLATIGLDPVSGQLRFTGGISQLSGGVGFIPMLIGLFAFSQVIAYCVDGIQSDNKMNICKQESVTFKSVLAVIKRYRFKIFRSGILGTVIGAIPGAGADIAAYVAYATRGKSTKEELSEEGIVIASASNNAAVAGAMIPALVFGIPGDSLSAIIIGILYMKGLRPGPTIFTSQKQEMITLFIAFMIANFLLLLFGAVAIKTFKNILKIPKNILMPIIVVFCVVGSFAVENTLFSILVMFSFGILGYFLEKHKYPLSPCVLGFVLAPLIEESFLTSLIKSDGIFFPFFTRPLAGLLSALLVIGIIIKIFIKKSKM